MRGISLEITLSDEERAILAHVAETGTLSEARRARIILMSEEQASVGDIANAVSLSTRQVRYWRTAWAERRLDIFPAQPDTAVLTDSDKTQAILTGEITQVVDSSRPAMPGVDTPRLPLELRERVGVLPDDSMAEAGRKVLLFHFERMLLHEPGSRTGEDIEAVHDMRVATRRMRSAFRLFRPFFKRKKLAAFQQEMRNIAGTLGDVRDLDVLIDKAQSFARKNPGTNLEPLLYLWNEQLDAARHLLINALDGKKYVHLVDEFHTFLTSPGKGVLAQPPGTAYQVRHVAPRLIYEQYEQVRAHETQFGEVSIPMLHALRIDFKRLRYTLEFFEEVLGPEAKQVIKNVKVMQDHLGDLHDADVAGINLREIIDGYNQAYSGTPVFMRPDLSDVIVYANAIDEEKCRLFDSFPQVWANFQRDEVRRWLALAVAVL